MNFTEAIQKLIEGKKIRRICWNEEHYWMFNNDKHIVNSKEDNPIINKKQLESDDWEIYKEKKVLKNIKLGRRNNHILVIETWQIGNILKLEEKEVKSIRDYLLSLGEFKEDKFYESMNYLSTLEKKEFCLSYYGIDKCELPFEGKVYEEENVRKFIKKIKEKIFSTNLIKDEFEIKEIIDKISGEGLI